MKEKTIVRMQFGSHLYGLNTPNSDIDIKAVFVPSLSNVLLFGPDQYRDKGTSDSSRKNTKEDVDDKEYSLGKFIDLAAKGEMMAIDMLHVPLEKTFISSSEWDHISKNRHLFYSKSMSGYLGYVRKQTAKYGFKGSRLNAANGIISVLERHSGEERVRSCLEELKGLVDGENIDINEGPGPNNTAMQYLYVVGKKFPETERVSRVRDSLLKFCDQYGHRAKLAAENEGVDWKAVSHAIRASVQLLQLYSEGTIEFPLNYVWKEIILDVKTGKKTWKECSDILESLIGHVENYSNNSSFPDRVDRLKVDEMTLEVYDMCYGLKRK